ncbi:MAG: YfhO family protein, partial [Mycobacterium sp.]
STPGEVALKRAVGHSLVGFGAPLCFLPPGLGITPNAQVTYGIQELALYDPMIPNAYFSAWKGLTHQVAGNPNDSAYCPVVTTADQARLYGVHFVLEQAGSPGPIGAVFDRRIGDEDLYRIPDAAAATLTPVTVIGRFPADSGAGTAVAVHHPDPASWKMVTDAAGSQVLRLRLTDVPGWHASIDGRSVPIHSFAGLMLQVNVPPGAHTVELHYWPATFTAGIALASLATAGLTIALLVGRFSRRRPG